MISFGNPGLCPQLISLTTGKNNEMITFRGLTKNGLCLPVEENG
jgi:hypothetical protein